MTLSPRSSSELTPYSKPHILLNPTILSRKMSVNERPIPLQTLRCLTPYAAFPRRDQRAWEENAGYGSRHVMDTAPFTLWDMEKGDFRMPTSLEDTWIRKTYSASSVTYNWPELIIETSNPPSPVPLTVACVTVIFLPEGGIPPLLDTNTSYSNPSTKTSHL